MNFPRLCDQKDLETLDYLILQTYSSAEGPISSRSSINDRNCPLATCWRHGPYPWLSQNLSCSVAYLSAGGHELPWRELLENTGTYICKKPQHVISAATLGWGMVGHHLSGMSMVKLREAERDILGPWALGWHRGRGRQQVSRLLIPNLSCCL